MGCHVYRSWKFQITEFGAKSVAVMYCCVYKQSRSVYFNSFRFFVIFPFPSMKFSQFYLDSLFLIAMLIQVSTILTQVRVLERDTHPAEENMNKLAVFVVVSFVLVSSLLNLSQGKSILIIFVKFKLRFVTSILQKVINC